MWEYDARLVRTLWRREQDGRQVPDYRRDRWPAGYWDRRADLILEHYESGPILIVGCGYGYSMEPLLDRGYDVTGLEPGPYWWEHPDFRADVTVFPVTVQEWLPDRRYGLVVDEDAISAHEDHELAGFHAALERCGDRVLHLVSSGYVGILNEHTLEEWVATAPHHEWVDLRGV